MNLINWHKNLAEKMINNLGISTYFAMWLSFIKGVGFGILIMFLFSCEEKVVIKKAPPVKSDKIIDSINFDYSVGVKGNCGMCKTTIEQSVLKLDFIKEANWSIKTKILSLKLENSIDFNENILEETISLSGYETTNTKANQDAYNSLPQCCKYDKKMNVPASKILQTTLDMP